MVPKSKSVVSYVYVFFVFFLTFVYTHDIGNSLYHGGHGHTQHFTTPKTCKEVNINTCWCPILLL